MVKPQERSHFWFQSKVKHPHIQRCRRTRVWLPFSFSTHSTVKRRHCKIPLSKTTYTRGAEQKPQAATNSSLKGSPVPFWAGNRTCTMPSNKSPARRRGGFITYCCTIPHSPCSDKAYAGCLSVHHSPSSPFPWLLPEDLRNDLELSFRLVLDLVNSHLLSGPKSSKGRLAWILKPVLKLQSTDCLEPGESALSQKVLKSRRGMRCWSSQIWQADLDRMLEMGAIGSRFPHTP